MTLSYIAKIWEGREHSVEEKIDMLEKHVFDFVNLKQKPEYYVKKGHFLGRYIAGFIHTYFSIFKDLSFIVLDPIHVFDILISFTKGIIKHPIRTLKCIWKVWTFYYWSGPYGLGVLTANALLAAMIAGALTAAAEGGEAVVAARAGAQTFTKKVVSSTTSLPRKFIKAGKVVKKVVTSPKKIFKMVMEKPRIVIADAAKSVKMKSAYGKIRTYKFYTNSFLKHRKTA